MSPNVNVILNVSTLIEFTRPLTNLFSYFFFKQMPSKGQKNECWMHVRDSPLWNRNCTSCFQVTIVKKGKEVMLVFWYHLESLGVGHINWKWQWRSTFLFLHHMLGKQQDCLQSSLLNESSKFSLQSEHSLPVIVMYTADVMLKGIVTILWTGELKLYLIVN